jgi:hypothetical protein
VIQFSNSEGEFYTQHDLNLVAINIKPTTNTLFNIYIYPRETHEGKTPITNKGLCIGLIIFGIIKQITKKSNSL